jgi:hypothetical protein
MIRVRDPGGIAAGLIVFCFAATLLWLSSSLPLGTPLRPGPGAWPVITSVLLLPLGIAILVRAMLTEGAPFEFGGMRRIGLPLVGLLLFALLLERFGLIVATPVLVVTASLADPQARIFGSLVSAGVITAFVIAVFPVLLGLQLRIGPW